MFSTPQNTRPSTKGSKRAARNAQLRAYYSEPLPLPAPTPTFNIFNPSTYKSLFLPTQPSKPYLGTWIPGTRSVNINNDTEGVELWRQGMWGKGTLSRSRPAWRDRRTKEMTGGRQPSLEEITAMKRKERAEFKEERVKRERLERERQLRVEGKLGTTDKPTEDKIEGRDDVDNPKRKRQRISLANKETELPVYTDDYLDKEVLQLAPEEALFLMNLDLLQIRDTTGQILSLSQFLNLVTTSSRPDDPFLVRYIVYYHFRRQRIIVKPGLKFGVDYLLYDNPIPFAHAAFCVNVLGSYQLWPEREQERMVRERVSWQEINLWQRLMGNVRKKLRMMWVEIPPPTNGDWRDVAGREDFEKVMARYKIRQAVNSRMVISRDREVKPAK
jgi:tRNA-splicing endonuclease subunit Sen2